MLGVHLALGVVQGLAAHLAHAFLDQFAVPDVDAEIGGEKGFQADVEVRFVTGFPDAGDDLFGVDAEVEAEEAVEPLQKFRW